MTEDEARALAAAIAPGAMPKLEQYAELLLAENTRQNLIARSTEALIWQRHLLDSLQLARYARAVDETWLDVGSGPGLPGLVIALAGRWQVTLVEPRRRRSEFLLSTIAAMEVSNVSVLTQDIQSVRGDWTVVSARAVAPIAGIFAMTRGCTTGTTRYILPKGRSAQRDVDLAGGDWHGSFHVEQSLTDPTAGILIADAVHQR